MKGKREKPSEGTKYRCRSCGAEVSARALLCPGCREPLTGKNAPVPVRPEPATPPPKPKPPKAPRPGPTLAATRGRLPALDKEDDDADSPSLPPLGRAVGKHESLLRSAVGRTEEIWASRRQAARKNPKLFAFAAVVAGLGLILFGHMLIVRPWKLRAPHLALSTQPVSIFEPRPDASAPAPSASLRDPGDAETKARLLNEAADQIERLASFLLPPPGAGIPQRNPSGPNDILPPIPPERMPQPGARRDEIARYEATLVQRERMMMQVAEYIVEARRRGVTIAQANAVGRLLRERGGEFAEDREAVSVRLSSPAATAELPPEAVEGIVRVLLGPDDSQPILRLLRPDR